MRMQRAVAIELEGLTKKFGSLTAVDRLNLEIYEGEIFALLGPNGAGKTTTISMLCGLLSPTAGKAYVAGFDVSKEALKVRQKIGIVFQQPSVDDLLSGKENLEMHALLYGVPADKRSQRIEEVISLVGLSERKDSPVKEYSGGMRKRLEIARGILHWPKILFLDEPTVGLDPQTRQHIWNYIRKMAQTEKTTIVFTTHYLEEAECFADRIGIIDRGKMVAIGKPSELVKNLGGDLAIFAGKDPNKLASCLKKTGCVKSIAVRKTRVEGIIENSKVMLPKILRTCKGIGSLEVRPATLNDVFIKLTGRQIREDSAEGGYWERIMKK